MTEPTHSTSGASRAGSEPSGRGHSGGEGSGHSGAGGSGHSGAEGREHTAGSGRSGQKGSGVAHPATGGAGQDVDDAHGGHGHSTAAWTAVTVILVGSVVMALAVVFPSVLWFVVGAVIAVVGAISGKVLSMAGYGAKASTYEAAHRPGQERADLPGRSQHDSGTE
jgi:uncharacterized protein DUF6704